MPLVPTLPLVHPPITKVLFIFSNLPNRVFSRRPACSKGEKNSLEAPSTEDWRNGSASEPSWIKQDDQHNSKKRDLLRGLHELLDQNPNPTS
jgi:hypothetical protein